MQTNPGLALSKIFEEAWEIVYADKKHQIHECSDLMSHFLMYMNGSGIDFQDVVDELSCRSEVIRKIRKSKSLIDIGKIIIGV